jgi:protein O-GlcNAc transferase
MTQTARNPLHFENSTDWSNYLYSLHFASDDPLEILQQHRHWEESFVKPRITPITKYWMAKNPLRRIRIGYLSPHFHHHWQSRFTIPLLSNHNRQEFQVHCYSDVSQEDDLTRRIAGYADIWRNSSKQTDDELATQIWEDGIEILVDLTLHMPGGRPLVFAQKPAPVQIASLAYPSTTGLKAIDYRLTDPHLDPPGQRDNLYAETSLRMPQTPCCFDPLQELPEIAPLPASKNGYITFGCLNNFSKITQSTLDLWRRTINQIPLSRMIVRVPSPDFQTQLTQALAIGDRLQCITGDPGPDDLRIYHQIDIGLNTFPFHGLKSSLESLIMGVPVLSLLGKTAVARIGLTQAANLGLADQLIANTQDDFGQLAAKLASDLPSLSSLRTSLRQKMRESPLMDANCFTRLLESGYRQMFQIWCRNV